MTTVATVRNTSIWVAAVFITNGVRDGVGEGETVGVPVTDVPLTTGSRPPLRVKVGINEGVVELVLVCDGDNVPDSEPLDSKLKVAATEVVRDEKREGEDSANAEVVAHLDCMELEETDCVC